jgi:hypothetical protein
LDGTLMYDDELGAAPYIPISKPTKEETVSSKWPTTNNVIGKKWKWKGHSVRSDVGRRRDGRMWD